MCSQDWGLGALGVARPRTRGDAGQPETGNEQNTTQAVRLTCRELGHIAQGRFRLQRRERGDTVDCFGLTLGPLPIFR